MTWPPPIYRAAFRPAARMSRWPWPSGSHPTSTRCCGRSLQQLPLECDVGAPLLFGQSNAVLARLIVPTAELLALHADVHRICGPHLLPGPLPHSLPGQWTAHVTLARRIEGAQLGPVLRIAGQPAEIRGRLAGLRRWDGTERVEYPIG